eukprot:COSAG01_NODE_2061_length_8482_cov_6.301925_6_plen_133_part_00
MSQNGGSLSRSLPAKASTSHTHCDTITIRVERSAREARLALTLYGTTQPVTNGQHKGVRAPRPRERERERGLGTVVASNTVVSPLRCGAVGGASPSRRGRLSGGAVVSADGESKRLAVESPWSPFTSGCRRV